MGVFDPLAKLFSLGEIEELDADTLQRIADAEELAQAQEKLEKNRGK